MGSIKNLSKFIPNAASLTDQPMLREENEKKKVRKIKLPVKKNSSGGTTLSNILRDLKGGGKDRTI